MQLLVRMSRLVRLVREVQSNPMDSVAATETSILAEKLYQTDLLRAIHDLVAKSSKRVWTLDVGLAKYYPESLHFNTMCVFEALVRYCFCRIIVIGLCRVLMKRGLFNPVHGTSTLAEQEGECAGMIAMSVHYAEQLKDPVPMGAFLAIVPLQVAFGTWCRSERDSAGARNSDADVKESEYLDKAQFMMEWCRLKSNDMLQLWNGEQMSSDLLKAQVKILEGGALEDWKGQRLFPL